ncbi:MAG TPA: hypothetical protein VF278_03640 [Pirellulales bacterium]
MKTASVADLKSHLNDYLEQSRLGNRARLLARGARRIMNAVTTESGDKSPALQDGESAIIDRDGLK